MNTIKQIKQEFNDITRLRMFEIEVLNKETNETEYIIFDINIVKNSLVAQHESLTKKEERSKKIAFKKIAIDKYFSLDENLQSLYDECIDGILNSDFYELTA